MPAYDFSCGACEELFEITMEIERSSLPVYCPNCAAPMTKKVSIPAVIFKGPGFYSTDNKKRES